MSETENRVEDSPHHPNHLSEAESPTREAATGRGRRKDEGKREAILRTARELFLREGVRNVSMDAIAVGAAVSKATVYSHYADKGALLQAVLQGEAPKNPPQLSMETPRDREHFQAELVQFGVGLQTFLTRPNVVDLGRLLAHEAHRHPESAAQFYAWGPGATHQRLSVYFAQANQSGILACKNPVQAAEQLLSLWNGLRSMRQQLGLCPPPTEEEIREHVADSVSLVLRAYAVPYPGA